jgi:hypothetical protein
VAALQTILRCPEDVRCFSVMSRFFALVACRRDRRRSELPPGAVVGVELPLACAGLRAYFAAEYSLQDGNFPNASEDEPPRASGTAPPPAATLASSRAAAAAVAGRADGEGVYEAMFEWARLLQCAWAAGAPLGAPPLPSAAAASAPWAASYAQAADSPRPAMPPPTWHYGTVPAAPKAAGFMPAA